MVRSLDVEMSTPASFQQPPTALPSVNVNLVPESCSSFARHHDNNTIRVATRPPLAGRLFVTFV